jgi:uncharacterized membrane protein
MQRRGGRSPDRRSTTDGGRTVLQGFIKYFLRGLLTLVPITLTVYVAYFVFVTIDGWINVESLLDRRIPGVGVALTVVLITLTGVLASTFWARWIFGLTDRLFRKLPIVKLLYTSLNDLIGAFVGEQRRFDRPVLVRPVEDAEVQFVGFETRRRLNEFGMYDHAAGYVPWFYNFGGNVILVPRSRVRPLNFDGVSAMTFVLSGGVTGRSANTKADEE